MGQFRGQPRGLHGQLTEHLLRRAGIGASPQEIDVYSSLGYAEAVEALINYEDVVDDVDARIGSPGYVGVTSRRRFDPASSVADARQRWLFRMVHSERPLQEKMALFWHNHFATAYSKVAGTLGAAEGARVMAAKAAEHPGGVRGQLEVFRAYALGNFRDLLVAMAQDEAMLVWLDGRTNIRNRPQENFARELMELFTVGVGFHTEPDVYAGARVFTGWNDVRVGDRSSTTSYRVFRYNANQHDTTAKEFSFPIYPDGSRRIPSRSASQGLQDGLDLINALARHPETPRRLARKLWRFFVSEVQAPDEALVERLAQVYFANNYAMKPVVRELLLSPQFTNPSAYFARYSWPVEFVVRALKEVGWKGFSVNDALTPLVNMGQQLFEPPDVNGWELGPAWFSSGGTLARRNFASALATNQKFALRESARGSGATASGLTSFFLDRLSLPPLDPQVRTALGDYLNAGAGWTGSDAQLLVKSAGLVHLLVGSGEYQLV
jgi:uncharacterized protein (DUF1800 family)